jgi:hypothetical protein
MPKLRAALAMAFGGVLGGCAHAPPIEYAGGACLVGGQRVAAAEVERMLLAATERAAVLQRWFLLVTIVIVVLACASHGDKLAFVFSRGGGPQKGLGDRVRAALDRHRVHPVRYFALVSGTLLLLIVAAGLYVYLDADKRQNERALTQLQFCHLALKSEAEQHTLSEQRRNLDAIAQTAGDIRALVDRLPPAEQAKAREIVAQINIALGRQRELVGDFMARSRELADAERQRGEALAKDVSSIETGLTGLRGLPQSVKELQDAAHKRDQALGTLDQKLGALDQKLGALDQKLDQKLGALDQKLGGLDRKVPDRRVAPDGGTSDRGH